MYTDTIETKLIIYITRDEHKHNENTVRSNQER
jgi:hypothetical protein